MWMHNGGLGGWKHIKRSLGAKLADKWYLGVQGGTDSEWAFALFLDTLERMGHDPSSPPPEGFGPNVIRKAVLKTISQINELIGKIPNSLLQSDRVDTRSLLNFAVTDGHSVVCTRYVSSTTDEAASLYYSSGSTWDDKKKGSFQMDRRDKGADIVLVASEPLTFERDNWVTVPTNSTLTIHKQTVMVHPIIDEYYSHNPYHFRSSKYVVEKGFVSNEKPAKDRAASISPLATPGLEDLNKELCPSKLQESMARIATPELTISIHDHETINEKENTKPLVSDLRSISTISGRDPSKPQELGNTKKKRSTPVEVDTLVVNVQTYNQRDSTDSTTLERTTSYGDPIKLAKYFPELNLS
jgi:glutamine amidotransferase